MQTLLSIYKWQVALAAALLYIVWPYVQSVVSWMSTNPVARELVVNTVIGLAGIIATLYILYTIWIDQRPNKASRAARS